MNNKIKVNFDTGISSDYISINGRIFPIEVINKAFNDYKEKIKNNEVSNLIAINDNTLFQSSPQDIFGKIIGIEDDEFEIEVFDNYKFILDLLNEDKAVLIGRWFTSNKDIKLLSLDIISK